MREREGVSASSREPSTVPRACMQATDASALSLSVVGLSSSVCVCVCGCEGSAAIAAAATATAAAIAVDSFPFSQFRVVPRSALLASFSSFLAAVECCRRSVETRARQKQHTQQQKIKEKHSN